MAVSGSGFVLILMLGLPAAAGPDGTTLDGLTETMGAGASITIFFSLSEGGVIDTSGGGLGGFIEIIGLSGFGAIVGSLAFAMASTSSPSTSSKTFLRFGTGGGGILTLIFGASGTTLTRVETVFDHTKISCVLRTLTFVEVCTKVLGMLVQR